MANYNNLKATINANIKANGNEEITGPILNTVLNQAVTTLGDGWSYKGIATPSMSPGTPDSNVFYIATTAGTYTNFGSLVVAEGEVAILKYNGSWAKEVTGAATAAQVTQLGQEVEKAREAGEYEQNPVYIRAYTDKDGRFLWGIRNDGNIEYGVGVPPQVVSYINERISELQLDEVSDIVDFLSGLLGGDETLKEYLDTTYGEYEENPEWIKVTSDADGRIIEGIKRDGTKVLNIPVSIEGVSHGIFNDPEGRLESTNDANGKILSYRDKDGVLVEKIGIKTEEIDLEKTGVDKLRSEINKVYDTVKEAVEDGYVGVFQCGTNMVVGLKELTSPYTPKEIEENYKNILPNPKFPFIKTVSLHRLYDDAATPNMLYMCSCSDKHIFYSICPTDTKRAFGTVDPDYYTKYTANYFYYADKETPSVLHKVILPASYTKRIKFVFEMSNGDCLIEIENGSPVPGMSVASYNNIYVVKGVFSGTPVQESDITFSLTFDYWLSKISSFDNIVEYKAGHIVLAPYSGGRSGKVYISHDYGATWDLIFCADSENTHFIKPKAEHYGDENAYGLYPLAEQMNPGGELDWDATGNVNVHIHGIAYDRWYDRIWIVTGDGGWNQPHNVTGIWWTDDEGYTWKRIGGSMEIGTQLIGIVPMEHCVIFPTDGAGNGFWRWSRNGKDTIIKIEPCYNYTDVSGLAVYGGRSTIAENGFRLTTFAPENYNVQGWSNLGGVVATFNGYDFEKIYEDSFGDGTYETAEIGCCCGIVDCGDKVILSAYYGGYIELTY